MRRMLLLVAAAALSVAGQARAETPDFSGSQVPAMSLMQRGRMFAGTNWWARYGEPVNAVAMAQAEISPAEKNSYGAPVPLHGDGYIYGPGACDCSPPCVWNLWAGYFSNPKRCHPGHLLHRHCGCGDCGHCRLLGRCGSGCNVGCATPSCAEPVSCTAAAPDCGCKPVCGKCRHFHVGERWRGFRAHWHSGCDSCSSPLGCGCSVPVEPALMGSEKQALQGPPSPLPEEAVLFALPRLN